MKKFLSILLVVMLVLSMIPATVSAADTTATISFSDAANRTKSTTSQQVWEQNGIKVTYDKAGYNNNLAEYAPVRFYAATKVTIEYPKMTKLEFTCSSGYADDLQASTYPSGVTASYTGNVVTVTPAAAMDSITITIGKQTRVSSLTITASASACDHNPVEQNDGQAATCTATGWTNSFVCSECGETTTDRIVTPTISHNYVNGTCTMCFKTEPQGYVEIDLSKDGFYEDVVIVGTKEGATYALPSSEATSKGSVTVQAVTVADGVLDIADFDNVQWDVTVANGQMIFQPAGNTELYLYCLADNNGVRVSSRAEHEGYETFVMENGYLKNVNRGRYLGVYLTQDWRCYTSHTTANIANQTFAFYAPKQAAEETKPIVDADGNGFDNVGNALSGGHTVLKATDGTALPLDVTLEATGNPRFISLGADENGYYTYYQVDLKLTAVNIRSSTAGMYFQAKIECDEELAELVDGYGVVLSTNDLPGTDLEAEDNVLAEGEAEFTGDQELFSVSVFNIFKDGADNATRGDISVYVNVYLKVGDRIVMSEQEVSLSFHEALGKLNTKLAQGMELTGVQETALRDFAGKYVDVLTKWGLTEITQI